ncbi:energy transducer TonB [Spirosoma flavum]|uniref:Energy transducer TonB n=1 Tax=Spirosoma flavum TaxID=2048557 RepID=A0ABW6AIX0_9BACT
MPSYALIILLGSGLALSAQAQQAPLDSNSVPVRKIFTVVQEPPQFPGGMNQLRTYLRENMKYPQAARQAKKEGKVFVSFIVNERGGIEEARALKSLDPALDAEAVRLVESMPAWTPGKVNGLVVACRYNLPITFDL